MNRNIRSRARIDKALPFMPETFTTRDIATAANVDVRAASNLIRERDDIEVHRVNNGHITVWRYTKFGEKG